ncbi:UrvD/REP family ATP-dependent DNA helicase [Luteimicrobium xylanilyticum]|uniref:UrvD/REP family ATP-dependent DNA helicase n=1 Tax=Luteimicrobium xylanilyticum TaxID=1133546 RepID=UPI001D15C8B6|nr:UrvD/REP family ATP-dependent DNA helicase [Luteimicrobium xylanilyticum]
MPPAPAVSLLPPAPPELRTAASDGGLDPAQTAALEAAAGLGAGEALVVLGAPGTGKTTVAVEVAALALAQGAAPHEVLLLAPSRRAADSLRDVLTYRAASTLSAPLVRTAASAAFAVLCSRAEALGDPLPTLVSGPEQDLLLSELLAGHVAGAGVPLRLPPGLPEEVLGLRGFRQELRDLLMRAAEHDLLPSELAALGRLHDRPEWELAAQLYEEYLAVTALGTGTPDRGARVDPAVVVAEAADALRTWDADLPGVPRPRWRLVVVDDYQEATAATAALLEVLRDAGARLVLLGDPDVAVQTFRGASPALLGQAGARPGRGPGQVGAFDARTVHLGTAWRHPEGLRDVVTRVTAAIPTLGAAAHRRATPGGPIDGAGRVGVDAEPVVDVATFVSGAEETAHVARVLRAEHLLRGTPWERMAVVARAGGQLAALRRGLLAAQVPVNLLGSDVPLRDEPAVRPLLEVVGVALDLEAAGGTDDDAASPVDPDVVADLLTSPVGGLDVVGLRRLRRALRAEERAGGGGRASDALLAEVVEHPSRAATLPATVRAPAERVARVVEAARVAAREPDADAQSVLWAAWDATGLAERWQRLALEGGTAGARADRDLDAVLALFRAAETFVDRLPQAPARAFLDYLGSQDLPADTLAAQAVGAGSVSALTPAGAAGGEWDVVVVTSVQDGVWPDLRLRDSLLGSQALVEMLARRELGGAEGETGAAARRAVLADELRAFAVAVSRARRRLVVTAVDDADERPSVFLDLVEAPPEEGRTPRRREASLDLRGLVASLRRDLVEGAVTADSAARGPGAPDRTAALLADLARAGVSGADPAGWYGAGDVTSDAPLHPGEERVVVSPSRVELVDACALRWALETAGGTAPDATVQTLGTLVHAVAEALPDGGHAALAAELDRRFPELGLKPGWPATQTRRRADAMVERLAGYLKDRTALAVEVPFRVDVGERATLRGVIDRVEATGDAGAVEVVDLKTGRNAPSKADTEQHAQLGAYQLAVELGGLDGSKQPEGGPGADLPDGARPAGARLVYLGTGRNAALRDQPALDEQPDGGAWAAELVDGVARTMAGSAFVAQENRLCGSCPVRRTCPAQPEGRQVIA